MLRVERGQSNVLLLLQSALPLRFLEFDLLGLLFLSICSLDRVTIFVQGRAGLLLFFLDHLNLLITCQRVPLHSVPHAVSLIVHVIDAEAVDFGSRVNDLPRSDPLLVIALLADEGLHIVNLPKVVHFKGIFRIDFLHKMRACEKSLADERKRRRRAGGLTFAAYI